MTTENTALTVQARAAVALGSSKAETELVELASKSKSIVAITNKDGRTECHAAAMVAKDARVGIEKAGKAAREDATAFSKAVIAEEKRLVDLIEPEEKRLIGLRDEWDAKVKAEKEAAEAAERARIAAIQEKIELIKRGPMNAAMLDAAGAETVLDLAIEIEIDDSFGEFYGDAVEAKADAVAKLREIVAAKTSAESTAARIKAEQEAEAASLAAERERMAAERAELDRQQAEQRAAEAKRQAEERARLDADRAELDRQRKEIADAWAEKERIAADKSEAERAEANRIAAEEIRRIDAERKDAALAEAEKLAAENQPNNPTEATTTGTAETPLTGNQEAAPGATIKLGEICSRLGFDITAEFLASLGYRPVATNKNAKLYAEAQFRGICSALVQHISNVAVGMKKAA